MQSSTKKSSKKPKPKVITTYFWTCSICLMSPMDIKRYPACIDCGHERCGSCFVWKETSDDL